MTSRRWDYCLTLRYVALLRPIRNLPMQPFRDALEELGFDEATSYGTTGNLLFAARKADIVSLEARIERKLKIKTIVRTQSEIARIVAANPLRDAPAAAVLFLIRPPNAARRRDFLALDLEPPRPALRGKTLFYSYPVRLRGRRSPLDVESVLGTKGTFRTARVVDRLHDLLRGA